MTHLSEQPPNELIRRPFAKEGSLNARLLNLTEASTILRTPEGTLRYWRQRGCGPRSFKIGRRIMYDAAELNDWIQAQQVAGN